MIGRTRLGRLFTGWRRAFISLANWGNSEKEGMPSLFLFKLVHLPMSKTVVILVIKKEFMPSIPIKGVPATGPKL